MFVSAVWMCAVVSVWCAGLAPGGVLTSAVPRASTVASAVGPAVAATEVTSCAAVKPIFETKNLSVSCCLYRLPSWKRDI
ncbi:Protein of unknown function [Gryllus bimaculatus]|nr:Protein of unknown function [Gryllus bimaculatus]